MSFVYSALLATSALILVFDSIATAMPIQGSIEIRPTWAFATGREDTRTTFGINGRISEKLRVYYNQGLNFDLKNPKSFGGRRFAIVDGIVGLDAGNFPLDDGQSFSLSLHPVILLPTDSLARSNGLMAGVKHSLTFEKRFSSVMLALSLNHALFAYKQAGGQNASGRAAANPTFENGLEVLARIPLITVLTLNLAVKFYQLRYASFQSGALHNDQWVFRVARASELLYLIGPSTTLGISFQTGNFTEEDLTEFSVGQAWSKGILQLVLALVL